MQEQPLNLNGEKQQHEELSRVINRVNGQSYKGKPPEYINVAELGSYTVGLMDSCRLELLSLTDEPEHIHREIIDRTAMDFMENPSLGKYVKEHTVGFKEAMVFTLGLDEPLSTGDTVIYAAAFRDSDFNTVVGSHLLRTPKYWVILGLSKEEVEQAYVNKDYMELGNGES